MYNRNKNKGFFAILHRIKRAATTDKLILIGLYVFVVGFFAHFFGLLFAACLFGFFIIHSLGYDIGRKIKGMETEVLWSIIGSSGGLGRLQDRFDSRNNESFVLMMGSVPVAAVCPIIFGLYWFTGNVKFAAVTYFLALFSLTCLMPTVIFDGGHILAALTDSFSQKRKAYIFYAGIIFTSIYFWILRPDIALMMFFGFCIAYFLYRKEDKLDREACERPWSGIIDTVEKKEGYFEAVSYREKYGITKYQDQLPRPMSWKEFKKNLVSWLLLAAYFAIFAYWSSLIVGGNVISYLK